MKVFRRITRFQGGHKCTVVALGVFDGVHRGHQKVIHYAVNRAKKIKGLSIVITFDPHPVHVLNPLKYCPLIISVQHRLNLIEEMGVDGVIVVPFTKRFARLGYEQFVKKSLLDKIQMREIVVGDDFHFGCGHQGTAQSLKQLGRRYGFQTTVVPAGDRGRKTISSSSIRKYVANGDLSKASRLLGRPVTLMGQVVHGDARGKTLGYPTANIQPAQGTLLPAGVFVVSILIGRRRYYGLANVGRRPSFKSLQEVNVEVHIFNFKQNIYGKEILIEFLKKIREEKIFLCQEDLVKQIQSDEKHAWMFLSRRGA